MDSLGSRSVALLLLGLVLFAVLTTAEPYDFLSGRTRVTMKPTPEEVEFLRRTGAGFRVYSFKADLKAFLDEATEELRARDFVGPIIAIEGRPAEFGAKGADYHYLKRATEADLRPPYTWPEGVWVYPHARVGPSSFEAMQKVARLQKDKGWVTVLVEGAKERTWFDRLRSLFGL